MAIRADNNSLAAVILGLPIRHAPVLPPDWRVLKCSQTYGVFEFWFWGKNYLTYHALGFRVLCPSKYPIHSWCSRSPGVPGAREDSTNVAERGGVDVLVVPISINAEHSR